MSSRNRNSVRGDLPRQQRSRLDITAVRRTTHRPIGRGRSFWSLHSSTRSTSCDTHVVRGAARSRDGTLPKGVEASLISQRRWRVRSSSAARSRRRSSVISFAATPRRRCARCVHHSCRIHVAISTFMSGVRQSTDRTTSIGAARVHRCTQHSGRRDHDEDEGPARWSCSSPQSCGGSVVCLGGCVRSSRVSHVSNSARRRTCDTGAV